MFCACTEETSRVLSDRRLETLRALADRSYQAKTAEEACKIASEELAHNLNDLPFTLLYLFDANSRKAHLCGKSGINSVTAAKLNTINIDSADSPWPFQDVLTHVKTIVMTKFEEKLGSFSGGDWPESTQRVLVLPLIKAPAKKVTGFLVAGISPSLKLDDSYRSFLDLVANQAATAIANASTYQEEHQRAEELAKLNRAKTVFFSNLSHEFRIPLTLILDPLKEAIAEIKEPQQQQRFKLMYRNALRLQKMVNNLLDFSRIEADRMQARYEPVDLVELTAELASVFRSAIEKAGMMFIVDCKPLDAPFYVDLDMYEKIVLNLLSNAFKYTLAGKITVKLDDLGSCVELSIMDTGIGIAQEQLPHIFERFHRIEATEARTQEGTGIGLALVKELVKLHGGTIEVKSRLGQGSKFTVNIPKRYIHLPNAQPIAVAPVSSTMLTKKHYVAEALHWLPNVSYDTNLKDSTLIANKFPMGLSSENRPRIVWADDNKDLRGYVTRLLSLRYEVETVSNGKAALAAIRRRPPNLILVDVMMPDLNGFDVLHAVRADKYLRSIPVILLSARAGEEVQIEGIASGADDYLIKPFRTHELLARVDVHLKMASLKAAAEKAVKESEKKLAIELQSAQQLQHISSRLIKESTIDAMCEEILDTAMAIMNSEFSSIQILDTKHDTLRLLAWKNFHPKSAEYWQEVSFKTGTICGAALLHNERIIVPNLYEAEFLKNSESLPYFLLSGITAVQSTPLTARDGRVLGMISTHWRERHEPNKHQLALFDVLARQLADVLERQHSLEALKESDRRKDEFLAVLAHELRNPLFPLKNAIYLLLSDSNSNLPLLQMMERQITHIIRLVDDLMEISRITTGKIELHKKFTNLGTIINNAIEICKPLLERNHQQVILSLPHLPLVVHADTVRMTQVFANLFNNSAKYSPDNSLILVNVSCAENTISVSVKDNGIGISKEMLPKIFEMFTQENRSIKPHNRGLGIGLAMVRKLLELQGGSVKASSAGLNQGSEFIVSLPLVRKKEEETEEHKVLHKHLSYATLRILIVDDNPDVLDSLTMILQLWEINVRSADNGRSALEILDDFNPNIILLDIGMPDMNGYEIAKKIRQNSKYDAFKLVAITGWSQEKDRIKSKASGFDEHLTKPLDINELDKLLQEEIR